MTDSDALDGASEPPSPAPEIPPKLISPAEHKKVQREAQNLRSRLRATEAERDRERERADANEAALEAALKGQTTAPQSPEPVDRPASPAPTSPELDDVVLDRDAAAVVASARPWDFGRVFAAVRGLVRRGADGALLLSSEDGSTLPLTAPTLLRIAPDEFPPAGGRDVLPGGSGGGTPRLQTAAVPADLVERGTRSQQFFDANRAAINAEMKRRGGQ